MDASDEIRSLLAAIAKVIRSKGFQIFSNNFLEEFCDEFEDVEENRLRWTELHQEYVRLSEQLISKELGNSGTVQDVAARLTELLSTGAEPDLDEASVESLDFILTLGDFLSFKDSMLVRKTHRAIETLELLEMEKDTAVAQRESELAELALMQEKLNEKCDDLAK
mmetsp:Transcript_137273/g.242681  ORF Transcript_137273/g.242681 Transcript_137273/m.242681 type:complete len:166 (-) Transcript_137273:111-608(-)